MDSPINSEHNPDETEESFDPSTAERLSILLSNTLYRFDCPEPDELVLYAQRQLNGFRTGEIALHLDTCPHCMGELAAWRDFQASMKTPSTPRRAIRWIPAWLQPNIAPAVTVRGNSQNLRVYATPEWQLLLMVEQAEASFKRISGQLIPIGETSSTVEAHALLYTVRDQNVFQRTDLDELGSFNFDRLPPQTYALHISIDPYTQIVVDKLTVANQSLD